MDNWLANIVDDVDSLHVEIDNLNNLLVGFCFIRSIDKIQKKTRLQPTWPVNRNIMLQIAAFGDIYLVTSYVPFGTQDNDPCGS
jgi:hypothetical protein